MEEESCSISDESDGDDITTAARDVTADHDAVNTSTSSHDHQQSPPDGASVSTDDTEEDVTDQQLDSSPTDDKADGMAKLPRDDWLSTDSILQLLRQPPAEPVHSCVPRGRKDNSYCLVDNKVNVARHCRGE